MRLLILQWLLLLLLLLLSLLLFLFGQVMADGASGGRADDGMMPGHMPGNRTDRGTLEAALRLHSIRCHQERQARQVGHQDLLRCTARHMISP